MGDLIALARLSFAQSRMTIGLAVAYFVTLHTSAWLYVATSPAAAQEFENNLGPWLVLGSLPLVAVTLGLFNFADRADLNHRGTSYLPWLLRAPVAGWKLAAVPIALKTLWIVIACGSVAASAALIGAPLRRWFVPALGISCLAVLACYLAWRPFRRANTRVILAIALMIPCYLWLMGCVATAFLPGNKEFLQWFGMYVEQALLLIAVGVFGLLAWQSIVAIEMARRNVVGLPLEKSWFRGTEVADIQEFDRGKEWPFQGLPAFTPSRAMLRLDWGKTSAFSCRAVTVAWCLFMLFWCSFDQPGLPAIFVLAVILSYPAVIVSDLMISSGDGRYLPNLLAMAPIPTARIAWTRQITVTLIWLASLSGIPIVLAVWAMRGETSTMAREWNMSMEFVFGNPSAGGPAAACLGLMMLLLIVRQSTWTAAVAATDRKRYGFYSMIAKLAIGFGCFSWFLFYFLRFPDWVAWQVWMREQLTSLPTALAWLLGLKVVLVVLAMRKFHRSGLATSRALWVILIVYTVLTIACASLFWRWSPTDQWQFWHCMAASALMMPLSRILIAPPCLASNRHRA